MTRVIHIDAQVPRCYLFIDSDIDPCNDRHRARRIIVANLGIWITDLL